MISRAMGWLTLFLIGTDLFVMSPLLPSITRELDVPAADGGWAVTTFAAAYLVGGPSFGSLADRTSRSRVLGIGLAVFALANLATALVDSFAALLAVRALAGLAASGVTPSVYALVSSAAPPAKRAMWLAVVTSGLLTALITGAPAGTLMADAVGWRGVFVVMAIASVLILGVIWASAVRPRRPAAAVGASGPPPQPAATAAPPPGHDARVHPAPAAGGIGNDAVGARRLRDLHLPRHHPDQHRAPDVLAAGRRARLLRPRRDRREPRGRAAHRPLGRPHGQHRQPQRTRRPQHGARPDARRPGGRAPARPRVPSRSPHTPTSPPSRPGSSPTSPRTAGR